MKIRGFILAVALMFAVILGFVPGLETAMTVHAADNSGVCSDCGNIAWKLEGTTLTISKVDGASSGDMCDECKGQWKNLNYTKVDIKPYVTSICDEAFRNCLTLVNATVPASVKSIGWGAFSGCENLTTITLSEGLTNIGSGAFNSCYNLVNITIPKTVTSIGAQSFSLCINLKSITIPDGVTRIEYQTFFACQGMTNITIPESVKYIGQDAFNNCSNLTNVIIPNSVIIIEKNAFVWCESLLTAKVPCGLKEQISEKDIFLECPTVITYTHPATTCTSNDTKDTITGICSCGKKTYTASLKAPSKTAYTGKAIEATCTGTNADFLPIITYSGNKLVNGKPVYPGTYTAMFTYGDKKVSLKYTITEASAPAKPHKITNVVSGVHVYWTAVNGVSKYGLWRSENGINGTYKWIGNPTVAHFTDTKVESGKTYYYKVTTLDTVNNVHSEKSAAIGTTYVATPDITLRVNRAAGIGLGWDKIPGATGYAIYRKPYDGNSDWVRVTTITDPNTLKWDDTSVKTANGTVYRYTIRALAGSNRTILSGCRATGRTMVRLTSRDLNSAVKTGATSIKCTWGTTTQATGYEVRFMVGNTVYKTYTIGNYKTGVKTFTDLKAGQTYKIQVRTYKKVEGVGSFYSAWSTAKTVSL